jgi:hypothetical protein
MYVFVIPNLVAIPFAIISHPHLQPVLQGAINPGTA